MYDLEGKRSLVLCGTRGIGLGVAHCLARQGSSVTVSGSDHDRALTAVQLLPGTGHSAFSCDFADPTNVGDRVAETGPYDIIVLNSPGAPPDTVEQVSMAGLRHAMDLMLLSLRNAVDAGLPAMRRNRWGRLIAITSSSLSMPITDLATSSVARAAVRPYLKLLADSVAGFGITVNYVIPGKINTDRLRSADAASARRLGTDVGSVATTAMEAIPLGRYGTPEDVGELVAFLASDRAAYITGTGIRCDGGLDRSI
ncbi:SDR family oxidoreductase [Longispora sp. NPDC051575]|uniref:SDR family oxidoreductase n=1 Tax=Longispora sp. NPDC051575 TaxID=3154943 RepID=UPI0034368146